MTENETKSNGEYSDGTDGDSRSAASRTNLAESLALTAEAEEKYEVCPECGEEYIGLDTTMAGDIAFIHQNSPLNYCTVEPETGRGEE